MEANIRFVHCHGEGGEGGVYESSGAPSRAEPTHSTRDGEGVEPLVATPLNFPRA